MMNLSRLLRNTSNMSLDLLYWKNGNLSEGLGLTTCRSRAGFSTATHHSTPNGNEIISVPYTVFKGKAALSVSPVLPTFTILNSGMQVVDRKGVMMLKFVPAIGERRYEWDKKQMFALSPTEVGSLISMGPNESCEFFHDPSMKSSNAGQVRKSLSIKAHATGGGYMISLNVVNNILKTKESISVPFTVAEFAVVKTACSYALPHILGWDQLAKKRGSPRDTEGVSPSSSFKVDRRLLDTEWDK